jgi:ubiquinone/menaquinone biosynthesis C-methylase UbiE
MNKEQFIKQFKSGRIKMDEGVMRYFNKNHRKHSYLKYRFSWIIPKIIGKKVLEVGMGDGLGIILYTQIKEVEEIYAIDVCPFVLKATKKNILDKLGKMDNIHLSKMIAEDMTFEDNSFDCVSLCETLEHVYDAQETLKQIHRVLKPGGRLVLTVPHGGKTSKAHLRVFNETYTKSLLKDFKIESFEILKYPPIKKLPPDSIQAVIATKEK